MTGQLTFVISLFHHLVNQCDWGLICHYRVWNEAVPGCTGVPITGEDYCIKPTDPLQLVIMGDEDEGTFPLQMCQGDCDDDSDCAAGLTCMERNGIQEVPGCVGAGESGHDYCYNAGNPVTPAPTSSPTETPTKSPTEKPTESPTGSPTSSPVASPTDPPTGSPTGSPVASPTDPPTGSPTGSPVAPVAGPTDPPTRSPTDSPVASPTDPPTGSPTDSPVASPTDPPTRSPTDSPVASPTDPPTEAPTPSPTQGTAMALVGNNGSPSSAFPLQLCQADCDDDYEVRKSMTAQRLRYGTYRFLNIDMHSHLSETFDFSAIGG